jgi:hypothetical protein
MIRYTLKCDQDHGFESWFQNAAAYEALARSGHLACPTCGSSAVRKSLMAPRVTPARSKAQEPKSLPPPVQAALPKADQSPTDLPAVSENSASDIAKIKEKIESSSDYVGMEFAAEARAMHEGDAPERSIYGEAKPEEALKLLDEGIPVLPLPFIPTRKTN